MPGIVDILIRGNNKDALAALTTLATRVTSLFGAGGAMAALVHFTKQAIDAAEAMGELAQKTGIAVQKLSGLSAVAEADSVSVHQMQVAIKGLSEWMVKTGQSSRDVNDVLLEQAELFASMPDGAQKISMAMDRFGRSGQDLIPFLNKGRDAIREQMREAADFGVVIGPKFAHMADTFNDNLHRIGLIFRGLFLQLANALLPELNKLLEWMLKFARDTGAHKAVLFTLIDMYKVFAETIVIISGAFQALGAFIGAIGGNFSHSLNPIKAWNAALAASKKEMDEMKARVEEIAALGKGSEPPAAPGAGGLISQEQVRREAALKAEEFRKHFQDALANPRLSGKEARSLALENLLGVEKAIRDQMQALSNQFFNEHSIDELAFFEQLLGLQKQLAEVEKERRGLQLEDDFFERLHKNLKTLSDDWGNVAKNMADALTTGVATAVNGVSDAITDAIYQTKTWGEVFTQVGRSIIANLIQVVVNWIAQMTVVRALKAIFKAEDSAQASSTAAAHAPGAALAATESYGTAAIIGAVALAAILALAIAGAAGAFAEGGMVRGGEQLIRVNERGTEAVLNALATQNLGEAAIASLNAGRSPGESLAAAPGPAPANQNNVKIGFFDDPAKMQSWLESTDGEAVVIDVVKRNLHQLTGKA